MGEGEGGGECPNRVPPHLYPLPPRGERRYFTGFFSEQSKMKRMKKKYFFAVAFGLGIFLVVHVPFLQAQKNPNRLTFLYTNNINGEIDPCPV